MTWFNWIYKSSCGNVGREEEEHKVYALWCQKIEDFDSGYNSFDWLVSCWQGLTCLKQVRRSVWGENPQVNLKCCFMAQAYCVRNMRDSTVMHLSHPAVKCLIVCIVFPELGNSADLYVTNSGSNGYDGIHKFGQSRVGPEKHDKGDLFLWWPEKFLYLNDFPLVVHYVPRLYTQLMALFVCLSEQHYVGLVLSRRRDEPLQDKVYAFYKEKNTDTNMLSHRWLPFVSQVCMVRSDVEI